MSRRLQSKYKISRRLGMNLWGRDKDAYNTRAYSPGMHSGSRRKPSDYGIQLMAKQRLRGYYGEITEKQFRSYYKKADRLKGDTSENLVGLLERRLDAFIYRTAIVPTIFSARQFVNHGHVTVNGKKVNIGSYQLKPGDEVTVREKSKSIPMIIQNTQKPERTAPEYISFDDKELKAKLIRIPNFQEIPYPVIMEPNLVVEYYSR